MLWGLLQQNAVWLVSFSFSHIWRSLCPRCLYLTMFPTVPSGTYYSVPFNVFLFISDSSEIASLTLIFTSQVLLIFLFKLGFNFASYLGKHFHGSSYLNKVISVLSKENLYFYSGLKLQYYTSVFNCSF